MFAEACLMQGWDLKCERNAGRRSGQTRFVSFLIPRFILVSGKDWLVFVLLVLIQSLGDELFKHWKDNQRSSCEFWIPVFQSGLRSSLSACGRPAQIWVCCGSICIVNHAPFLKSKGAPCTCARASSPHIFSRPSPALNIWFSGARNHRHTWRESRHSGSQRCKEVLFLHSCWRRDPDEGSGGSFGRMLWAVVVQMLLAAYVWLHADGQLPTSALAPSQVVDPDEQMKRRDERAGVRWLRDL